MNKQYKVIIVLSIILIGLLIDFNMNYSKEPIDTNIIINEPEITKEEIEITPIEEPEIPTLDYEFRFLLSFVGLYLLFYIMQKLAE